MLKHSKLYTKYGKTIIFYKSYYWCDLVFVKFWTRRNAVQNHAILEKICWRILSTYSSIVSAKFRSGEYLLQNTSAVTLENKVNSRKISEQGIQKLPHKLCRKRILAKNYTKVTQVTVPNDMIRYL